MAEPTSQDEDNFDRPLIAKTFVSTTIDETIREI